MVVPEMVFGFGGLGHSYGDETYQTSPYAPSPNTPHRSMAEEAPHRRQVPGLPVRLHCKADPNFSLAIVPGQGPVMKHTDSNDDYQVSIVKSLLLYICWGIPWHEIFWC